MKDLSIEYRNGKFVRLVIDGVEMKDVTSIQFSHAVGQEVPTVTVSGHVVSGWERHSETRTGRQTFGIARRRQVDYISCEIISNATISNENESHQGRGIKSSKPLPQMTAAKV
jgi:hypothetical protein